MSSGGDSDTNLRDLRDPRDSRDPSRVGQVIASKYRLDQELGRGGMGAVYRAYHLRVHKEFAIKVLLNEVAAHASITKRFQLEAQAAGRIGHPGILEVYDVGDDVDGTSFIVMELLRGEPLAALVRRERLDVDAACWIAMEVLDVLDAAHRAGIIHRDVKPQNVFLTEKSADSIESPASQPGTRGVKLLDFGIAKFGSGSGDTSALTRSGEIIGSPLYMAPEQAKGEPDLDARADVWSVGAMLFEMLTGKCAHAATTPVAVLAKILTEPAPPPSTKDDRVPPELDAVVTRALCIDRKERYESAQAMRDALLEFRKLRGMADKVPALPAAPKRSLPPPSPHDRTPGAITSTVALPSEPTPPKRPWSSRPLAEATSAPSQLRAEAELHTHAPPSRPRMFVAGGALIAGIALVAWYVGAHGGGGGGSTAAPANPAVTTAPSIEAPSATSSSTEPSATPPVEAATAASSVSPSISVKPPPSPSPLKCAAGEIVSKGHCCARGLEWQGTRCERPLATTF